MGSNSLELEISRYADRLKIGLSSNKTGLETVRHYDEKRFNPERVSEKCSGVLRLMHNMNLRGPLDGELLSQLQVAGFGLFEELLPANIQDELSSFKSGSLVISMDDSLVPIPWELIYDGDRFLSLRYSTGRIVRTPLKIRHSSPRSMSDPLRMLILCNPCNDLQRAYVECDRIRNEIDHSSYKIHADLLNRRVGMQTLKEWIRNYDLLHFAGHADYDPHAPDKSGWLLQDGKLTPAEIRRMSTRMPLPSLIFSNACQSAQTAAWSTGNDCDGSMHSLAQAFLMSGVRHYLGTCWEVLDDAGCDFATFFYQGLLNGYPVGESVRKARLQLSQTFGPANIAWAGYILYGHPETVYFKESPITAENRKAGDSIDLYGPSPPVGGATRSLPLDRKTFNLTFLSYTVILTALIALVYLFTVRLHTPNQPLADHPPAYDHRVAEGSGHMVKILEALSRKYAAQQKATHRPPASDPWTTQPATLSFTGFKPVGLSPGIYQTEQALTAGLTRYFVQGGRLVPVERRQLIQILNELQISSSDIADQRDALTLLGRLVGARYVAAGELLETGKRLSASLRLIETSTSKILFSVNEEFTQNEIEACAKTISDACAVAIKRHAPIKGRIKRMDQNTAVLNLGLTHGVRPGMVFETVPNDFITSGANAALQPAARLTIYKAFSNHSLANSSSNPAPLEVNMKIIESVP